MKKLSNTKKTNDENDSNLINLTYVNNRIEQEVCNETLSFSFEEKDKITFGKKQSFFPNETINKLTDSYLLDEYKKCKSVQNKIKKFELLLDENNINSTSKKNITNGYILDLIPAGTKGVIRGNKFNSIVQNTITNMKLNNERFEIAFEKQCKSCITSEKPDWYILEKSTDKVIIGMNQLDLVGGGQQLNRGYKYLIDNEPGEKVLTFSSARLGKLKEFHPINIIPEKVNYYVLFVIK
jgi:hypothetical protein